MIDNRLKSEITQLKLIVSAAELLNFNSILTRFIKSGSRYNLGCMGELISC
jgi:hypothetical protein